MGVRPAEHVVTGLSDRFVTEVERLASELVTLAEVGVDVTDIGEGSHRGVPGGLRRVPLLADGWFYVLPLSRCRLIAVTRVVPPFTDC
ncbi:hypothetical protein [Streptomyces sichuanensis]|uniref:hypothetical protein n=1 Tax=Streptomyces sichuanensis TaxID=2871810 RepID=UPI0027E125FA|nr:hypothetical protein [Streptomyces sichuanensis]